MDSNHYEEINNDFVNYSTVYNTYLDKIAR